MLRANAVHWARATAWHRIICALEEDLQQLSLSAGELERALLYDKLDLLRTAFYEQLRVAERNFLQLKGIKKDAVLEGIEKQGGEEMKGAQRKIFDHALGVVKLCKIVEEIDELGDQEDAFESVYARMLEEYDEKLRVVQLSEIAVRIESLKKGRNSVMSL